jgi:hypothetical protein
MLALALGACTVSIFENGNGNGTGSNAGSGSSGAPPPPPATCGAACVGDAGQDFNGTPTGKTGRWRYLEDHRDHTWTAMAAKDASASVVSGADPANHITTCAAQPTAAGCKALPGALLISSSGSTSPADPAIEFTAATDQVLTLDLHALASTGAPQQVRIYRNSREDALITQIADIGKQVDQTITLDALRGDRFLIALAPAGAGATDVALQVFLSPTGDKFPKACQFALDFEPAAMGATFVTDRCNGTFNHMAVNDDTLAETSTAPKFAASAFAELGQAADFARGDYFAGSSEVDASKPFTVQLWVQLRKQDVIEHGWPFSMLDFDVGDTKGGGGLGLAMLNPELSPSAQFDLESVTVAADNATVDAETPYQLGQWYFVRMVQTATAVDLCINGVHKGSIAVAPPLATSTFPPYLGRNVVWNPQGAYFNGMIDDFRVISSALPCN